MRRFVPILAALLLAAVPAAPGAAQPFAWIAARRSAAVAVLDTATDTVVDFVHVGDGPMATAVHPDGREVYVTSGPGDALVVIDAATRSVAARVPVGDNPTGLDVGPTGEAVYVANAAARSLSIVDTRTRAVLATLPLASHPFAVAVAPDGRSVYVGGDFPAELTVVDAVRRRVVATIPVGGSLGALAVHPTGAFVYAADSAGDALVVIDAAARRVVDRVPVGRSPIGVAVHPEGGRVYVTNLLDAGVVSVVDAATRTRIATIQQPGLSLAAGAAVTPDGRRLYVANRATHDLVSIDTGTNAILGERIPAGGEPTGFGRFVGPGAAASTARAAAPAAGTVARASAPEAPASARAAGDPDEIAVPATVALMPGAAVGPGDDVVYVREDCVYVLDFDTGRETALTGRPAPADPARPICDDPELRPVRHAAVSHDRRRLAFNVGEDLEGRVETRLYVVDLATREVRRLLPGFARVAVGGIDFAPNGDLYFVGVSLGDASDPRVADASEVFRVSAALDAVAQVTDLPNRGAADVSVSADGRKLVFNTLVLTTGNLEVTETDLDGANPRVVIQAGALWLDSVHDPEHSDDSSKVVYSRIRARLPDGSPCGPVDSWGGDRCHDLYTQRVSGGAPTLVSQVGDAAVVPDWKGGVLLYHFARGRFGAPGSWLGSVVAREDGPILAPFGTYNVFARWLP